MVLNAHSPGTWEVEASVGHLTRPSLWLDIPKSKPSQPIFAEENKESSGLGWVWVVGHREADE